MLMDIWKTKKFSSLSKKWAKKLADTGFIDIETEVNGQRVLKQDSNYCFRNENRNQVFIESKQKYYQLVSNAANWDYEMGKRDKIIMLNYSDGVKHAEIIKQLEKEGLGCNRITITRTITKYLLKWKIPVLKQRKTK